MKKWPKAKDQPEPVSDAVRTEPTLSLGSYQWAEQAGDVSIPCSLKFTSSESLKQKPQTS